MRIPLLSLFTCCLAFATTEATASDGADFSAGPLFPRVKGMTWNYKVTALPANDPYDRPRYGTYQIVVTDLSSQPGMEIFTIREHGSFSGRYRFSKWIVSNSGVRIEEIEYPGPLSFAASGFGFEFLRFPFFEGQKIDDGNWISETEAMEWIDVPGLGRQKIWRVSVIGVYGPQYTAVGTYWILPGWGIVQSSLIAHGWDLFSEVIERLP